MNELKDVSSPNDVKPRRRAWVWPSIIVGMLSVHTISCLIVVFIATGDPSQAVVADYHTKAVNWDQTQAQVRRSEALGWACEIETSLVADRMGQRTVRLSLRDAADEPLTGAAVTLDMFHHVRANQVVHAELKESTPGEYVALASMRRDGLWTFALEVKLGEIDFTAHIDQQVGENVWRQRSP